MKIRRTRHEAGGGVEASEVAVLTPERGERSLGEILVSRGAVDPAQVEAVLAEQQHDEGRLGELLVAQGAIDERTLTEALAEQHDLRVVDLRRFAPEPDAVGRLDAVTARSLRVLPLRISDNGPIVALDEVPTAEMLATLRRHLGHNFGVLLAPPSDLTRALDQCYRDLDHVGRFVDAFRLSAEARGIVETQAGDVLDDNAPIVRIISLLLNQAVTDRASDIHLEPQDNSLRVRFRVDGALHEVLTLPATMAQSLVSRIKIMAEMNIVERRRAQDGQFEFNADGRTLDVRAATVPMFWGEKVVLRLLDRNRSLLELSDLGMPPSTGTEFSKLIRSPFGMVIVAGPTGSGKTTTLYAALNEINHAESNITTIEDPIEYVFPSINQIPINEAAEMTFATGLKAILRQDPDIILVGEMRDVETTRIAVQSALTGHLVLTSLHATDAAAALQRFLDMGIESFLVASSVIAVVAQRLVRRSCRHCLAPYEPSAEELAFYEQSGGQPKERFWHGEGCNFCSGTGYSDRIGVYELLRVNDRIKKLILERVTRDEIAEVAVSDGMRTMFEEGLVLVEHDVTTIGEIMRRIYIA